MRRFRSAGRFARPHAGQDKTLPLGPLTAEEAPVSGDTPPERKLFRHETSAAFVSPRLRKPDLTLRRSAAQSSGDRWRNCRNHVRYTLGRKPHPANVPDLATLPPQTPRPGPSHTAHAHPLSDGRPSSPHPRRPRLQKQRLRGGTRPTGAIRNYLRGLSGSRAITM